MPVNKDFRVCPGKRRNGEIFRRRSFFGTGVLFREKAKGGSKFLPALVGDFWFGRSFGQKVFPDQFCKISQHFSAFSSGCSLKKGGEIIDFHKRWGLLVFYKVWGFYYLGNIRLLSEFNHLQCVFNR